MVCSITQILVPRTFTILYYHDNRVMFRDLPLALLQANEELLSDEADPSGEDEADVNMDTQSEYDYPLPSTGQLLASLLLLSLSLLSLSLL